MSVLATLRQDRAGEWKSLDDYLRELRHRQSGALAALASALSAPAPEQRELAEHGDAGAILLEVASDLRVPKGARLAAARCLVEAGIEAPFVGHLFIGAGDLVTDPRLGAAGRKLVEAGLPAALEIGGEAAQIAPLAGAFARGVHAGASAIGQARIQELLAGAPELHAGAAAARFALGVQDLPAGHRAGWKRLLQQTIAAHRRAPAAAKRLGLAPSWPPNLPDAFAPMVREAEQEAAAAEPADAAKTPPAAAKAAPTPAKPGEKAKQKVPAPGPGKTLGPAIRRSPFRRSIGTVVEVPAAAPPKPMEPVAARHAATAADEHPRPRIEAKEGAAPSQRSSLPVAPLPTRDREEARFDSRGKRIPRTDRWDGDRFEWEAPALPSPDLPPPPKACAAPGPFAQRLQSILEDRPEAVERLCAAAEARAAMLGEEALLAELSLELSREVWRGRTLPPEQARRLRAAAHGAQPPSWSAAARRLLDFFVSGRG
ncbi:MAG: hypothetical protein ACXWLR_12865 [Myxococcales bacterium]